MASALSMLTFRVFRLITDQSRLAPALKLALNDSSSSPIFSESRVGVPSSSMRNARLAVPGASAGSAEYPLLTSKEKLTTGAVCRSATTSFKPLESLALCMGGRLREAALPKDGGLERSNGAGALKFMG